MGFCDMIKNPIVFGAIIGLLLCLMLFIHDKLFIKDSEKKSSLATYFKIFFAGFVVSAPMVFLLFNRNLSFKTSNTSVECGSSEHGGEASNDEISDVIEKVAETVKVSKHSKSGSKKVHTDEPNW
jgi:hypothetical protein